MTTSFDSYHSSTYGDHWADVYDDWFRVPKDTDEAVEFLVAAARGGPALELGIGTGRVALPLAARGIEVQGVDASASMVERLRAKPGGEAITVTLGDFADVPVEGSFSLVYVVFNTFFGLLTQDAQVRCLVETAKKLKPGGVFVIEAFVPDLTRYVRGQSVMTGAVRLDGVVLDCARHDAVNQQVSGHSVVMTEQGIRLYPVEIRYAWPSELDLMALLAGMRLRDRWGGWRNEPFTASSGRHVSVYELQE